MREKVGLLTKDGDMEPFMFVIFYTYKFSPQLIRSWGRRSMAMAGEVTRHGRAHPYSWSVTIFSLQVYKSDETNHRSEWKPNS